MYAWATYLPRSVRIVSSLDASQRVRVEAELVVAGGRVDDGGAVVGPDHLGRTLLPALAEYQGDPEGQEAKVEPHCWQSFPCKGKCLVLVCDGKCRVQRQENSCTGMRRARSRTARQDLTRGRTGTMPVFQQQRVWTTSASDIQGQLGLDQRAFALLAD